MLTYHSNAQDSGTLKQQAEEMANAGKNYNYAIVLKYTYPKILKNFTKEEALNAITNTMDILKSKGIEIENVIIGEPGIIYNAGKELHCLVPEKIIFKSKEGRFQDNSNLLAVSLDKGKNWYFIDCAIGKEDLMVIFPNFNNKLIIPKKSELVKLEN
ncbi:hypothetical protein [Flavobacterium sp. N1994]|uniref:hypothetical protein n=1 Tax=Flavobacterium sp. N1994 TaxID=2986827 RepID=UPI0022232644|nr:hypothetical protein [Flavobacterium sp. N1994]